MATINGRYRESYQEVTEAGSATIFVVFSMMIMFTLIVLVSDVGQLIFERIRLQTVVDACTLAAATQKAVGMNEIADLNWAAEQEYKKARRYLGTGKWYSSSHARRALSYHRKVLENIDLYRRIANNVFPLHAEQIAQRVKRQNLPNSILRSVAPSEQNSQLIGSYYTQRQSISYTYYIASCHGDKCPWPIVKKYMTPFDDYRYEGPHITYYRIPSRRLGTGFGSGSVPVQWVKRKHPTTYSAYSLSQETKPFILGSRLFDLTKMPLPDKIPKEYENYIRRFRTSVKMPRMVVYSAAKPTLGRIEGGNVGYSPIFNKLAALSPAPRISPGLLAKMEH